MTVHEYAYSIEDNRAYLIEENGHAILVDAPSEDLISKVTELELTLDYIFVTHEHCDHLWGLESIRREFNCATISTNEASRAFGDPKSNHAAFHHIYITLRFGSEASQNIAADPKLSCRESDIVFDEKMSICWQGRTLMFIPTPGHSHGSGSLLLNNLLFSGDTILKDEGIFTEFKDGSYEEYMNITFPFLMSLDKNTLVYPGHGDSFRLSDIQVGKRRERYNG